MSQAVRSRGAPFGRLQVGLDNHECLCMGRGGGETGGKVAGKLGGLRKSCVVRVGEPGRWSVFARRHFPRKFAGAESMQRQRICVARWTCVAACLNRDGAGSRPTSWSDDCAEDKHRLHLCRVPSRGDVLVEPLATSGRVRMLRRLACVAHIVVEHGLNFRIQLWADSNLHSILKALHSLGCMLRGRPRCQYGTMFKLNGRFLGPTVSRSSRPVVPMQFGLPPAGSPWAPSTLSGVCPGTAAVVPSLVSAPIKRSISSSHTLWRRQCKPTNLRGGRGHRLASKTKGFRP